MNVRAATCSWPDASTLHAHLQGQRPRGEQGLRVLDLHHMIALESNSGAGRGGIQVIARAAEILRALGAEPRGLTPSELAGRAGLPRSTVHRILAALEDEGLVAVVGPGRYRLGTGLGHLIATERRDVRVTARPLIEALAQLVEETVDLAVLVQDHVTFIDQVPAPQRLRAVSTVGATFPAHCTANGKALLAELSTDHVLALLPQELHPLTPDTVTDRSRLLAQLEEVRRIGYAIDREEHTIGISAVGGVVRDAYSAVAAVTIPLPSQRFAGQEQTLASALTACCAQISDALGGG